MASRKKPEAASPAPPKADITIGCCGFPVPATRYFQEEFTYVEVQDIHVNTNAMGTIRRWKRESPPSFRFAVMSPRDVGQEGYRDGKVVENALAQLVEVARELSAVTAVFIAPPDFAPSRANKSQLKDFLARTRPKWESVIWEAPPSWDADEASALCADLGVVAARDPLAHGTAPGEVGYYRMPGPAGYKSRYEDPAIDKLSQLAMDAKHARATYVFANVDMFADAKRFRKSLK
jgi:uncharacterized protein YecE (DUF72 family)